MKQGLLTTILSKQKRFTEKKGKQRFLETISGEDRFFVW